MPSFGVSLAPSQPEKKKFQTCLLWFTTDGAYISVGAHEHLFFKFVPTSSLQSVFMLLVLRSVVTRVHGLHSRMQVLVTHRMNG